MVKKAVCINNKDLYNRVIESKSGLHIGKVYMIEDVLKSDNYVYIYENRFKFGVYLKSNFRLIEDYRQERVDKLIK